MAEPDVITTGKPPVLFAARESGPVEAVSAFARVTRALPNATR